MIIGKLEELKERRELDNWRSKADFDPVLPLTPQKLKRLIQNPPKLCDEPDLCVSRYVCGSACRCIRSVFESEEQYYQWREAFEETVKRKIKQDAVKITEIKI